MTVSMRWAPELAGRLARRDLAPGGVRPRVAPYVDTRIGVRAPAPHPPAGGTWPSADGAATWRAGALLDEPAAHALGHRGRPVADTELLVDVLEVGLHGLRAEVQLAADRRRRLAARGQPQHLELARAEQRPRPRGL